MKPRGDGNSKSSATWRHYRSRCETSLKSSLGKGTCWDEETNFLSVPAAAAGTRTNVRILGNKPAYPPASDNQRRFIDVLEMLEAEKYRLVHGEPDVTEEDRSGLLKRTEGPPKPTVMVTPNAAAADMFAKVMDAAPGLPPRPRSPRLPCFLPELHCECGGMPLPPGGRAGG